MALNPTVRERDLYVFSALPRRKILAGHEITHDMGVKVDVREVLDRLSVAQSRVFELMAEDGSALKPVEPQHVPSFLSALSERLAEGGDARVVRHCPDASFYPLMQNCLQSGVLPRNKLINSPVAVLSWGDFSAPDARLVVPFKRYLLVDLPVLMVSSQWVSSAGLRA